MEAWFSQISQSDRAAMIQNFQQSITSALQELGHLRAELSEEEAAAIAEEERAAAVLDTDALDDSNRCVVCLTKQRAILLLPCRHLATCHGCTVLVRRSGKCPLCRQRIDNVKIA